MSRPLTPAEAAARLGVSAATVRRYVADGLLPAVRVGPRKLFLDAAAVAAMAPAFPSDAADASAAA